MTNKLPVVGKKYKLKNPIVEVDEITPLQIWVDGVEQLRGGYPKGEFFRFFEELPEDNQTDRVEKIKNLVQDGGQHNSDLKEWFKARSTCIQTSEENTLTLSKEVLEAMEELRDEVLKKMNDISVENMRCREKAQNLLNALDNQHKAENKCHKCKENSIAQIGWCSSCYGKFCKDINATNTNPNPWLQDSVIEMLEAISVPPPYPYRDCRFLDEKSIISIDFGKEGGDYTVETKYRKEGDKFIFEEFNVIKPKESIWKPVNELREKIKEYLSNGMSRSIRSRMDHDVYLALCSMELITQQFINQHNSLLDRVNRLEQIIGDKK